MPVIPEKLSARQDVRNAISAHFWEQPVQSARSVDGLVPTLPCEPCPLTQTGPSGLSRVQQLLMLQALGVPFMPAYCEYLGGLVLDRVILKAGNQSWWTTVSARVRAQRLWGMYKSGQKLGDALRDLNLYGATLRGRTALGKHTTLQAITEVPNLDVALHALQRDSAVAGSSGSAEGVQRGAVWSTTRLPGHALLAGISWNQLHLDSSAAYCRVPLTVTADVASNTRADGIQYRFGLHQVSAPEQESSSGGRGSRLASAWRSALHCQGAVAVEGETVLWRPDRRTQRRGATVEEASAAEAAAAAAGVGEEGTADPDAAQLAAIVTGKKEGNAGPSKGKRAASGKKGAGSKLLGGLEVDSIQSSLVQARSQIEELRKSLALLTRGVQDGRLLPAKASGQAKQRPWQRSGPKSRKAYSPFLSQPYVKANAAVGCLARIPLMPLRLPFTAADHPTSPPPPPSDAFPSTTATATAPSLASRPFSQQSPLAPEPLPGRLQALQQAWAPYLRGTALRMFASAGVAGQMGQFTRPVLDFTAASLRLDLGLTSPHLNVAGPAAAGTPDVFAPGSRPDFSALADDSFGQGSLGKHRAFALEGRGIWHAASASFAQQVIGPLRFRADCRVALDMPSLVQDEAGRNSLKGVWEAARGFRPTLLEAVYGLDCILPGSEGAARAAFWYSPMRKEAMVELRLF